MQLTSPAFTDNQPMPADYTCDGKNTNPPLAVSDVPADAKSLALIVHDPDAVSGDFSHWLIWNLAPSSAAMKADEVPPGAVEGTTDFGKIGYGGPCPPATTGTHRYMFELYALDKMLDLPTSTTRTALEATMAEYVLEKTTFIGLYRRQ